MPHRRTTPLIYLCLLLTAMAGSATAQQPTPQQKRARANREKLKKLGITVKRAERTEADAIETRMDVVYASDGDRKLHLDLFLPRERQQKTAAVLIIHGGGWFKGERRSFHAMAEALALRGYVAAAVEYRLAGEALFPASVHDCNAATRWLRANAEELNVDPGRIAAVGGSAGGHLVGLMATAPHVAKLQGTGGSTEHSCELQAAVVMAGPMQMTTGSVADRSRKQPAQSNANRWLGKGVDEAPELYALAAPFKHVSKDSAPISFMAGEYDKPERNLPTRSLLRTHGVETSITAYRYGLHACWNQQPWFDAMVGDVDEFLRSVLGEPGGQVQPRPLNPDGTIRAYRDRVEIDVGLLNQQTTKVHMPRLNNPIGKVLVKGTATPIRIWPELTTWELTVPKAASGKTIVVETVGQPHLPVIPRIVSAQPDGTVVLAAHDAVTHGRLLRYEPQPHKNTVGYWADEKDWVEWHFFTEQPGTYEMHILQGCGEGHGGSEVVAHLGDQKATFTVEDTGHFQNFRDRRVATLEVRKAGVHTLQFRVKRKARIAVMDVRQVRLVPTRR